MVCFVLMSLKKKKINSDKNIKNFQVLTVFPNCIHFAGPCTATETTRLKYVSALILPQPIIRTGFGALKWKFNSSTRDSWDWSLNGQSRLIPLAADRGSRVQSAKLKKKTYPLPQLLQGACNYQQVDKICHNIGRASRLYVRTSQKCCFEIYGKLTWQGKMTTDVHTCHLRFFRSCSYRYIQLLAGLWLTNLDIFFRSTSELWQMETSFIYEHCLTISFVEGGA